MAENTSWVNQKDGERLAEELGDWFLQQAGREARLVAPKAIEYGSRSLVAIGRDLAHLGGHTVTDQQATELAIWSYVNGKMQRWTEAVMEGKPVSDDTLLDLGLYIKMAQRNREYGSWPGVRKPHPLDVKLDNEELSEPTLPSTRTHQVLKINSDWRTEFRGIVEKEQFRLPQYDIVSKITGETRKQLIQYADPYTGFFKQDQPDPECSGWHSPNGYKYCLRPGDTVPGIELHEPLPTKKAN